MGLCMVCGDSTLVSVVCDCCHRPKYYCGKHIHVSVAHNHQSSHITRD
ncbi:MAG: hypothetical protein WC307_06295 [Candidatus Nanoarchaeia archaeon]|jgi:hypothetical protein